MQENQINPKKINEYSFEVEKQANMKVPLKIFASEKLMEHMKKDKCIGQGMNVAALPGILGKSLMMPDAHQGYGFPIGGVAAIKVDGGCISPGGVGFDINCSVRLLTSNLKKEQVTEKIKELLGELFKNIPAGVGAKSNIRLTDEELDDVLTNGAYFALKKGYGNEDDAKLCEQGGRFEEADPKFVSQKAKSRGRGQLGTLGAGNHFLEIQYVDKIFDNEIARTFGIFEEGQIVVMIHCGSRGLGHQVCSDSLRKMEDAFPEIMAKLPEKDLIYAPSDSHLSHEYFKAMSAAANYTWANKQVIVHQVREAFKSIFGDSIELKTMYDVAHNICKKEEHEVDGEKHMCWVHRKGATRAFGPGRLEIPEKYREVGQPVIIPGSMGTSSYVLVGTEKAMKESFGSTAHGAGRVMSRHAAHKLWKGDQIKKQLEDEKIFVKAASWKGIVEEAPGVYKDIDEVVKVSHDAGIANLVARVRPIGVVKG